MPAEQGQAGPPHGGRFILGVDVGGTFTDAALIDGETGELRRAKLPTTVADQSQGTLATIADLDLEAADLAVFSHGTTAGINALLERRGAKTGLICTEGTRDMLNAGRFTRENAGIYDPTWKRPQQTRPVVHRRHIREISARMLYDGRVHIELDEDQVRRELEFLRTEGIEALGICLLNSYLNLEHEQRVAELARELLPDVYIQSSSVRPVIGEYTRTSAVMLDSYTGPVVARYLRRLEEGLDAIGYQGPALIMQMHGGLRTLSSTIENFPAYTLLSGPVAGLLGAEYYAGNFLDVENLVCVDIGGTSTDLGLVIDGAVQTVDEWEAEWALPLGMPAVDVRSIGAGGGSIIQADAMGTLRVGPESAGAEPGPASYRRGGLLPAMTDAHVVLGTLRPSTFLGGRMELDVEAAFDALTKLAQSLEMDTYELARGAIQLMNAHIESEVSKTVFERGVDLSSFSLFSYGGAGSLHAVEVARLAGIGEVIVPVMAGGFSALGLATAPPKVERAISRVELLDQFQLDQLAALFGELEQEVRDDLDSQGVPPDQIEYTRTLSGMYTGQSFSNELTIDEWPPTREVIERWRSRFDDLYDRLYGYRAPEMTVTVTTLSVTGVGPRPELRAPKLAPGGESPEAAFDGSRSVFMEGAGAEAPFYRRGDLLAENTIPGPAVIEDPMTTIWVPTGAVARVDDYGNVRIDVGGSSLRPAGRRLDPHGESEAP